MNQSNAENQTAVLQGVVDLEVKHEATLYAERVADVGSFHLTNALLTSTGAVIVIALIAVAIRLKLREVPRGIQNFFGISALQAQFRKSRNSD